MEHSTIIIMIFGHPIYRKGNEALDIRIWHFRKMIYCILDVLEIARQRNPSSECVACYRRNPFKLYKVTERTLQATDGEPCRQRMKNLAGNGWRTLQATDREPCCATATLFPVRVPTPRAPRARGIKPRIITYLVFNFEPTGLNVESRH